MYVYHEIVHNTRVVEYFRERGVRFVDSVEQVPEGAVLLFSAHGIAPTIRRSAEARRLHTIDATCPLVKKVHQDVLGFAEAGIKIILIGHAGHDEVVGIMGEAPEDITLIERIEEIDRLQFAPDEQLACLTQTTLSVIETESMFERLRERFPDILLPSASGVCFATQHRQEVVRTLAPEVDVVLVIGSRNSSNSRRLAEIAESLGVCSYLVDGPDDVRDGLFFGSETVLVTAGASAPETVVRQCLDVLVQRFNATVEERIVREEKMRFAPPREL